MINMNKIIIHNTIESDITEIENGIIINLPNNSWILCTEYNPTFQENLHIFNELWELHPETYGKVQVFGKTYSTPRYTQSYNKSYKFSNILHEAIETPTIIENLITYANNFVSNNLWDAKYNQCLVNWYECGKHYIGAHSDDEKQLLTVNNITSVFSYTFLDLETPKLDKRIFRIKPKGKGTNRLDISLENNLIIIMGGELQKHYTHQVPKTTKEVSKRINITLRTFY